MTGAATAMPNSSPRRGPAPPKQLQATNALTIYNKVYPPQQFVVDDILPEGLTFAAGRPKVGKSWLTLQMAIAVALGEPALGRFPVSKVGRVTYLALEEPEGRTHRRLKELVPTSDPRLMNIQIIYQISPLMTGGADQLDAFLAANPSELVVIDTFLKFVAAHNKRQDVLRSDYLEGDRLMQIAHKHHCALVCVAHSRKASGDVIDSIIGTSGSTAAIDAAWQLQRLSTGESSLTVKGRDYEEQTYGLKLHTESPFGWQVTGEGADVGMSEERREIVLILQQEGAKKPADIARLLGNKNINTTRRLIQKLTLSNVIRQQTNGTYIAVNGVNDVNGGNS